MPVKTIFTLNARENIFLDLLKIEYKFDQSTIYRTINESFQDCLNILDQKKVNYKDLKNGH